MRRACGRVRRDALAQGAPTHVRACVRARALRRLTCSSLWQSECVTVEASLLECARYTSGTARGSPLV
ncbi:unnamed protein product [Taenia asiatica]|uniref:CHCH domain-containing protein n=1 Tax=Taenia asiatica TaxID=60517 RepID=A0A0R3W6W8_TAEAS|nr:unnamed protein product [Taenia asiatica]